MSEKGKAVKAVRDARGVPIELFGSGRFARDRKFVFLYLATWADPDGTDAFPGLKTIAKDCGLTVRGLSNILDWLAQHSLIAVEYKASHLGTNKYALLLTGDELKIARQEIESDEAQAAIRTKAENVRQARSEAAKSRWAKKMSADVERSVPCDVECSVPCDVEPSVPGTHGTNCIRRGTNCIRHGTQRSTNRPLDRPSYRERDRAEQTANASLSPADDDAKSKVKSASNADYGWIELQMAQNAWPITRQAEQIVRSGLSDGHSKEFIVAAIKSAMNCMPRGEKQPGLFLEQNLPGHLKLLMAGEIARRNDEIPRRPPDYLKQPPRGPLTDQEREDFEKTMAAMRLKMGIPEEIPAAKPTERAYPQLPVFDR